MTYKFLSGLALCIAAMSFSASSQGLADKTQHPAKPTLCTSPSSPVDEERFVRIRDAEHWVTIHGESCANPVILFLHGGPGNPLSPYATTILGTWSPNFTLVQWDQPGAGRTFGKGAMSADSTLSLERMVQDGIALAQHLTLHLGKKKIILTGGSWGSILGVHMAKARPDLFYAYVGVSQVVSYQENLTASYAAVMDLARSQNDLRTISALESMGSPPWVNPRNFGALRRATRPYERVNSTPAPQSWWIRAPEYNTPQRVAEYEAGEDFSYLQFVGLQGDGMFSRVNLHTLGTIFEVPVFMIHGLHDLVATPDVARNYFNSIVAPHKEFLMVPQAGHDLNEALIDVQYKLMLERIRPLAQ